jgi:hypothetical protein
MEQQTRDARCFGERIPGAAKVAHGFAILAGKKKIFRLFSPAKFRHKLAALFSERHDPAFPVFRFAGIKGDAISRSTCPQRIASIWGALERFWKPMREKRAGARRRPGMLHLAQAQSNRGRRGRKRDFPGYIFPFQKADTVSPPSVVGGAALFTDNGSKGLALAGGFYLKQNTYHITTVYFRGNINYDFYGIGTDARNEGSKLPLKQTGQAFLGEFLYRLGAKFFVGPRVLAGDSTITLRPSEGSAIPLPPNIGIDTSLIALGFRMNRDTRPNRFYPVKGTLFDVTSNFFSQGLSSKYSFQSHRSTFNYYRSFGSKQVLAYNLFLRATAGGPPFYGECIFGTNNELRGYVAGQYIDRDMVATQLEYRLELPWRFGIVVFGGIGEVAPSVSQFRYDNILPAGGGGVRFKLSQKYNVNLRADIAQGKDGHTFSMGIGEAF